MKKIILTLFFLLSSFSFGKELKILVPNGLPKMAMAQMIEEKKDLLGNPISYLLPKTSDTVVVEMMKGEVDAAIIPSNLAVQLYHKKGNYKILASVTNSSFYILGRRSLEDVKHLRNQVVYSFGRALTPDIVLQSVLKENQVERGLQVRYLSSPVEALQLFLQNKDSFAFLPEPQVSQALEKQAGELKVVFSMEEEWKKVFPETSGFPQAVLVMKEDVLEDANLKRELLSSVEKSIAFLKEATPLRRTEILKKQGFAFSQKVQEEILTRANIVWKPIATEKENFKKYYQILEKENPKIIGGKVPQDDIYAK